MKKLIAIILSLMFAASGAVASASGEMVQDSVVADGVPGRLMWVPDSLADGFRSVLEGRSKIVRDYSLIDPKEKKKNPEEMTLQDMELIRYEKYDYVLIVCRNEIDYKNLQRALGLEKRKMIVSQKRKIQARAVWYDDIKAQIVSKDEILEMESGSE